MSRTRILECPYPNDLPQGQLLETREEIVRCTDPFTVYESCKIVSQAAVWEWAAKHHQVDITHSAPFSVDSLSQHSAHIFFSKFASDLWSAFSFKSLPNSSISRREYIYLSPDRSQRGVSLHRPTCRRSRCGQSSYSRTEIPIGILQVEREETNRFRFASSH